MNIYRFLAVSAIALSVVFSCVKEERFVCGQSEKEANAQFTVGGKSIKQFATKAMSGNSLKDLSPYLFERDTVFFVANYENGWMDSGPERRYFQV